MSVRVSVLNCVCYEATPKETKLFCVRSTVCLCLSARLSVFACVYPPMGTSFMPQSHKTLTFNRSAYTAPTVVEDSLNV